MTTAWMRCDWAYDISPMLKRLYGISDEQIALSADVHEGSGGRLRVWRERRERRYARRDERLTRASRMLLMLAIEAAAWSAAMLFPALFSVGPVALIGVVSDPVSTLLRARPLALTSACSPGQASTSDGGGISDTSSGGGSGGDDLRLLGGGILACARVSVLLLLLSVSLLVLGVAAEVVALTLRSAVATSGALRAEAVVNADAATVFALFLRLDSTRHLWDSSFEHGRVLRRVSAHSDVTQLTLRPPASLLSGTFLGSAVLGSLLFASGARGGPKVELLRRWYADVGEREKLTLVATSLRGGDSASRGGDSASRGGGEGLFELVVGCYCVSVTALDETGSSSLVQMVVETGWELSGARGSGGGSRLARLVNWLLQGTAGGGGGGGGGGRGVDERADGGEVAAKWAAKEDPKEGARGSAVAGGACGSPWARLRWPDGAQAASMLRGLQGLQAHVEASAVLGGSADAASFAPVGEAHAAHSAHATRAAETGEGGVQPGEAGAAVRDAASHAEHASAHETPRGGRHSAAPDALDSGLCARSAYMSPTAAEEAAVGDGGAKAAEQRGEKLVRPSESVALDQWLSQWRLSNVEDFGERACEHAWSESPAELFQIRSQNYLNDKIKQPSAASAFRLRSVLIVPSADKIEHIVASNPLPPRPPHAPLCFVIMVKVPGSPRLHLVLLFERSVESDLGKDPRDLRAFTALLERCTSEECLSLLCGRLKIVPNLVEGGGWFARKTVGNKPAIVANALRQVQFRGDGYVEVDIDVEVSAMAKHILSIVKPLSRSLALDLAFVLEGQSEAELPERLLGGVRLHRINLSEERIC